jgi:hypothetical protein
MLLFGYGIKWITLYRKERVMAISKLLHCYEQPVCSSQRRRKLLPHLIRYERRV